MCIRDSFGEGTKADKQALLLNKINNEFVKVKKDVTPLVMCPTQYLSLIHICDQVAVHQQNRIEDFRRRVQIVVGGDD